MEPKEKLQEVLNRDSNSPLALEGWVTGSLGQMEEEQKGLWRDEKIRLE